MRILRLLARVWQNYVLVVYTHGWTVGVRAVYEARETGTPFSIGEQLVVGKRKSSACEKRSPSACELLLVEGGRKGGVNSKPVIASDGGDKGKESTLALRRV